MANFNMVIQKEFKIFRNLDFNFLTIIFFEGILNPGAKNNLLGSLKLGLKSSAPNLLLDLFTFNYFNKKEIIFIENKESQILIFLERLFYGDHASCINTLTQEGRNCQFLSKINNAPFFIRLFFNLGY